jgi:SprT protein
MSTLKKLTTLQNKVLKRIKELQATSMEKYGVAPEMKISYNLTSVNTLGSANYYKGTMRLNKYLLLEYGDVYIDEVVVHEYAHFVVNERIMQGHFCSRPKPHGREFKQVCAYFGIVGKATTNKFSNSKFLNEKRENLDAKKKVFFYQCSCPGFKELTSVRHNKIQRGRATYSCNRCGTMLRFVKQAQKMIS